MKWFKDGDQVVVTKDDFIDLQESPAVFVPEGSEAALAIQRDGILGLAIGDLMVIKGLLDSGGGEIAPAAGAEGARAMLYKRIDDPQEGEMVQFLGVYATRWPWDSGVEPTVAFVEAEDELTAALEDCIKRLRVWEAHLEVDDPTLEMDDVIRTIKQARAAMARRGA